MTLVRILQHPSIAQAALIGGVELYGFFVKLAEIKPSSEDDTKLSPVHRLKYVCCVLAEDVIYGPAHGR